MARIVRATRRAGVVVLAALAAALPAHAGGGHFSVDDAALLDPGQCQVEAWFESESGARTLAHLGPACRVGPVELGVNVDRLQGRDAGPMAVYGPQVKWARELDDRWSIGLVGLAGWRGSSARYVGAALYAPISWRVSESLTAHANVGADRLEGVGAAFGGVALDWQAAPAWLLVGEVFGRSSSRAARLGVRWQPLPALAIDLSRRTPFGPESAAAWTLGVNWVLDARPAGAR